MPKVMIDQDLYEVLKVYAKAQRRSVAGQVNAMLKDHTALQEIHNAKLEAIKAATPPPVQSIADQLKSLRR